MVKDTKEKEFKDKNLNEDNEKEEKKMSYYRNGRTYYRTKTEAIRASRAGDRIYYDAYEGAYYIVRPQRRKSFWGW